jgi:hypothetical protein
VVLTERQATSEVGTLLECLRYAGLIRLAYPHEQTEQSSTVFDIICPSGLVSKVWAEQNCQRMATFGYNAVAFKTLGLG